MIGAGGTGGHVYPALTAAEVLTTQNKHSLSFVGTRGGGGFERRLVDDSGLKFTAFHEVFAGPIAGVNPLRAMLSAVLMLVGTLQSFFLLLHERPGSILLTGGWANVPLAVAAYVLRIPMLVYLPDIEPGQTIQYLGKIAAKVAVSVPDAAQYFRPGQSVVTGYPLRASVKQATREAALKHFGLDATQKTLLVFGGSRGARSINEAVIAIVPELLAAGLQIIHVSGTLDWQNVQAAREKLTDAAGYHIYSYLEHDMGLALAAADIVVSRAGASTLGEFPYFGVAAILVPYPYAWRYQKTNADYLVNRNAAVRLDDERMNTELLPTILALAGDEQRLAAMQSAAKALAQPNGAENIAALMLELAGA
jgi:UDP-N-acetylglucosamine--N-acetylmuramyl-(pentapeptide) pyrophosphoryl-undecaprenol N-acetylglucosamine transferase